MLGNPCHLKTISKHFARISGWGVGRLGLGSEIIWLHMCMHTYEKTKAKGEFKATAAEASEENSDRQKPAVMASAIAELPIGGFQDIAADMDFTGCSKATANTKSQYHILYCQVLYISCLICICLAWYWNQYVLCILSICMPLYKYFDFKSYNNIEFDIIQHYV